MRLSIVFAVLCVSCASPWGPRDAVHPKANWCPSDTRLNVQRSQAPWENEAILSVSCLGENDRPLGPLMVWHQKSGRIQSLDFLDGHGKLHGPVLVWYPSGQLRASWVMVRDELEGPFTSWYPNGEVQERRFFRGGVLDGISELYDESGHLISVTRYASGKVVRDGDARTSAGAQPTP
jgi:hypothetical protein